MNNSIRLAIIFIVAIAAFLSVLSVSFLVEAAELPASALVAVVADTTEPDAAVIEWREGTAGIASWYGPGFHKRRTAGGTRFNMHEMTAAHKSLPFGSLVRVTNATNGKTVIVEITDRGPFIKKRVIDLSHAAARAVGVAVTPVTLGVATPADLLATVGTEFAIVLSNEGTMVRVPRSSLSVGDVYGRYAEAVRNAAENDAIAVMLSEAGKLVFAIVSQPAEQPLIAGLDTMWFDVQ